MNWSMSPSIGKLVEALAKAQLKFDKVLKDNDNPAFRSKYADLATVIEATRPFLASEGLAIMQMPHARFSDSDTKELTLTTLLAHSSGEWISSDLTLPAMMRERFDAQSVGSAITYARRYALSAMTGVAQEDDDGNKAAGVGTKEAANKVAAGKLREMVKGDMEPIQLIEYKENTLAITGNSLAILKAEMTDEEKTKVTPKWDSANKVWLLPAAQGHAFSAIAKQHNIECVWK
jgi:hypothetical protein